MARVTLQMLCANGKKYVAVAPMSVMPNDIYAYEGPLVINKKNGQAIALQPVFVEGDTVEELRKDLHKQVDDLMDVAAKVLG